MSAVVAGASTEGRRETEGETTGRGIVKQEKDSDIKDYAETTMNELLGWYGYDKLEPRGLNLKTIKHQPFTTTSSSSSSPIRAEDEISEEDTGHSASPPATEAERVQQGSTIICAWCLKMGLKLFTLKTASGETKEFCSEPCFNQCRRAAFKKNRICNWCRHVRHTVNYVDFQDGDDQLQFCSDKCLNQYKMQIFCKETQAYLQMNPHLQEEVNKNVASSKLITPDLWLRDCQESMNGGTSNSGDEKASSDKEQLEDLTVASKQTDGRTNQKPTYNAPDHETHKSTPLAKDSLAEKSSSSLASYFKYDEIDKYDRRKRHHEGRENMRKRQRLCSIRNKSCHLPEAPPAHLSSAHSALNFSNQSSFFSPVSSFSMSLRTKSPAVVNPPVAHSKSFNPPAGVASSVLHSRLPPPPPLLNNDFYHSPFSPHLFPSQQQHQLDSVLRMQAGLPPNVPFTSSLYQDSMLPMYRNPTPASPGPLPHPSTMMLPYPIFVPLPIPIPIPLPLTSFLPKNSKSSAQEQEDSKKSDSERTDNKSVKTSSPAEPESAVSSSKTTENTANSDSKDHKLLKRAKK